MTSPRSSAIANAASARRSVLVLDNDPTIISVIRRVLSAECDLTAFTDPRDGCELIRNGGRFDVILCDLLMPELGGAEVYASLRKLAWDQADRIVFVSGATTVPSAVRFLDSIPNARLDKPFTRDGLREIVRRVGRGRKQAAH